MHRKDIPLDGSTPTIMTAYGGFEISYTPFYSGTMGKLWLENRAGASRSRTSGAAGEFGPAWHEAGRKTKRQIIYDDFAAVANDIYARKLSSPAKFGIYGGSNGGLLMGVELNQHPDLWDAVVIQVPLLDMLRYELDPGRRVMGGRVRLGVGAGGGGVPRDDLAVPEPEAGRDVPGAVHLDDDQG